MADYDVIVVGGGISGILSALILSRHGKSVLVLEKDSTVGGNCRSYNVDGFQVDTGVHAITHLREGPLRRLIDDYFTYSPVFFDFGNYYVRTEKGLTKMFSNIKEFVMFDVLPRKDRLLLSQALTKALTQITFGTAEANQSVYDSLPKGLSKDTYDFVDAISYSLSGKSMKETSVHRILYGSSFIRDSVPENILEEPSLENTSTSLIIERLSKYQLTSHLSTLSRLATNKIAYAQGYPRGGLISLLNAALYSLPETVQIKTSSRVKEIMYGYGGVTGVITDSGELTADMVVYSGFAKNLPDLIDLPPDYKENLSRIEQTVSLTIWLGLSEKIKEFDYTGSEIWFKEGAYWAMPVSNYDPDLAPKDKQLIGFTLIIDGKKNVESEKKRAFDLILKAIPGIESRIEMVHYQVTIPEKAAVTINGFFASPRSPLANLYLVGTDTDNRSMGVTRAAYSVLELIKAMKEDKKL